MSALYWCLAQLIQAFRLLPLSTKRFFGSLGGRLFGLFPSREKEIIDLQLEFAFGEKRRVRAIDVFENIGLVAAESLGVKQVLHLDTHAIQCENWTEIRELIGGERSILALTAHFGSWEVLAGYIASQGVNLTVIGREARIPALQNVLASVREEVGVKTVWRSNAAGRREIIRGLRSPGRVVAALIDQDTQVKSEFVPFFGIPAKTPLSLVELAKRYNAQIVTAFMVRVTPGTFRLEVLPLADGLTALQVLEEYNKRLEALMIEHPEQWVWFHKRWCTRPNKPRFYTREYLAFLREECAKRKEKTHSSEPLSTAPLSS